MRTRRFKKKPKKPHVHMHISMWNKDSHGLYDFDSSPQNYELQDFFIDRSVSIFRNFEDSNRHLNPDETILQEKMSKSQLSEKLTLIGSILVEEAENRKVFKFQSQMKKQQNYHHNFYEVYRQANPQANQTNLDYSLKPGTIIKFGRVEFIVIEMKTNNQVCRIRQTNLFNDGYNIYEAKYMPDQQNDINCRICYCCEQTQTDPLISPCLCKGSSAKIHLGCLRQWITSKVRKQAGTLANSYNFTKFQCQLCKHPFPRFVKLNNVEIEMMKINKPENKPYIILQSLPKSVNEEKCLHLIEGKENSVIKIGRNYQSEIRITDISVSRAHAQILFKDNCFWIKDQKSKFGTLIKLPNDEIQLVNKKKYRLQLGRVLYELQVIDQSEEVDTQ